MSAYYNEFDPYAAEWLRNLIKAGHIAPGDVDERSIVDVQPEELRGYTQCHFFAGIGGWSHALRLALWDDARSVWTGSCPCQPFSNAGKKAAQSDERHLWPYWFRLIRECKPPVIFGEQVEGAIAKGWLDDAFHDLEGEAYAGAAAVLPACSVTDPQNRPRIFFVAHDNSVRERWRFREEGYSAQEGQREMGEADGERLRLQPIGVGSESGPMEITIGGGQSQPWVGPELFQPRENRQANNAFDASQDGLEWIECHDRKLRPIKSGIRLLVDGISGRVATLRPGAEGKKEEYWYHRGIALKGFGNAIDPKVTTEFIKAADHAIGG